MGGTLLVLFILVLLVCVFITVLYKILAKKGLHLFWKSLAFLPIVLAAFFIYNAFYPSSQFYREEFRQVVGVELPLNMKFKYKAASYPDFHGDYESVSIIQLQPDFYQQLLNIIRQNGLTEGGQIITSKGINKAEDHLSDLFIVREFSNESENEYHYIAFLSDEKSVIVQHVMR